LVDLWRLRVVSLRPEGGVRFQLNEPAELALAKQMVRLSEQLLKLEQELYPHVLCEYIYELSQKFNQFYESCPCLTAETPELKASRLAMCALTARILRLSLQLLGIQVLERM
jgi:arginyl-tRNA synthetase